MSEERELRLSRAQFDAPCWACPGSDWGGGGDHTGIASSSNPGISGWQYAAALGMIKSCSTTARWTTSATPKCAPAQRLLAEVRHTSRPPGSTVGPLKPLFSVGHLQYFRGFSGDFSEILGGTFVSGCAYIDSVFTAGIVPACM